MIRQRAVCGFFLSAVVLVGTSQAYYPQPIYPGEPWLYAEPYTSAGFVSVKVGRDSYRGSGAVARDSRLIYSCAHLFYDSGLWATGVRFARGYTGKARPPKKASVAVRGYYFLAGYAPNMEFSNDFAVAYGSSSFGPPLGVLPTSEAVSGLTGPGSKMILGYPADLDYTWERGYHFLHQTGPFPTRFQQLSGPWYEAVGVSTGGGNSGGPVLLPKDGSYKLAGILISGDDYGEAAGIYALSTASEAASNLALDYVENGAPERASIRKPMLMKDGATRFSKTTLTFKKIPPFITRANLDLLIFCQRGEVDAVLRSPAGRTHVVVDSSNRSTWANTDNENIDISSSFASSSDANGRWTLSYRDSVPGAPALLNWALLTLYTK